VIGDKNFWEKGVATEVVGSVSDYAFSILSIVRITAETEAENIAVCRVLEKPDLLKMEHLFLRE
jgi:RimJ/RimL family protein N-acetyltransferase